jgi:hypothetical protein
MESSFYSAIGFILLCVFVVLPFGFIYSWFEKARREREAQVAKEATIAAYQDGGMSPQEAEAKWKDKQDEAAEYWEKEGPILELQIEGWSRSAAIQKLKEDAEMDEQLIREVTAKRKSEATATLHEMPKSGYLYRKLQKEKARQEEREGRRTKSERS